MRRNRVQTKEELLQSIIRKYNSIKHKKAVSLDEGELKQLRLWMNNTEIAEHLLSTEAAQRMFRNNPQLEIDFIKSPIEHFSKWYAEAEAKKDFQKNEFVSRVAAIYSRLTEIKCISSEAEFIRLAYLDDYRKCEAAFKKLLKSERKEAASPFEDLLTGIDTMKIQPLLDSYKGAKAKDIAILCYALNIDIDKVGVTSLTKAINARFGTTHTRQNLSHHLKQCKDGSYTGRDKVIEKVRKGIQQLTR